MLRDCSALSGYPDPKISGILCAQVRAHMPCQNACSVELILKFKMNLKNSAHPKVRSEFENQSKHRRYQSSYVSLSNQPVAVLVRDAKGLQRFANDVARPSWPHPLALITREARCRDDLIGSQRLSWQNLLEKLCHVLDHLSVTQPGSASRRVTTFASRRHLPADTATFMC
jgi:hypothetical protein